MGVYRGQVKAPDRVAVMMLISLSAGGYYHWKKYQARGEKMPVAIVLGCPPLVAFTGPQKLKIGIDELTVAGALAGGPIHVVKAKTVDLEAPAESEIVIEGLVDTEYLEPEGPFGESHGYVALEEYNFCMQVTAITRRREPVIPSIISQVTPSESSVIKRVAYEPMYLSHLHDTLGVKGVTRVSMHEPLTNLRRFVMLTFARDTPKTEVWRALYGAAALMPAVGKYVIAINDDIDPDNGDAVFWAMGYRANPALVFVIRDASRAEAVRGSGVGVSDDGMKSVMELVGSAALKDIVSETTDVVEKMCIETAVELTRNNRVAAAEMLGLSRQSLYVKLRKYGLLRRDPN